MPQTSPDATASETVAQAIADEANAYGVPPAVALSAAMYETGHTLNPRAAGDRGYFDLSGNFVPDPASPPTSFGEYQLHEHGELGNHSPEWAYNVKNNASVAIPEIAKAREQHPGATWGQVVAFAQRPADTQTYAAGVDGILSDFHMSGISDPVAYFEKVSSYGGLTTSAAATAKDPNAGWSSGGKSVAPPSQQQGDPNGYTNGIPNAVPADWITGLDTALNPKINHGLNLLGDTAGALQLVAVRGGVALVGILFVGTGLLLMFGKEIFGGAIMAIPGVGEAAGALDAISAAGKVAAGARRAKGAQAVNRRLAKASGE